MPKDIELTNILKRKAVLLTLVLMIAASTAYQGCSQESVVIEGDRNQVKTAVWDFIDATFNRFDIDAVERTLHADYLRINNLRNRLVMSTRYGFMNGIKYSQLMGSEGHNETVDFPAVELSGNTALAECNCIVNGELFGRDYFLFHRFRDGWKIVESIDQHITPGLIEVAEDVQNREKDEIIRVINNAYIDGAINLVDTSFIRNGFHPGFHLLVSGDEKIERIALDQFIGILSGREKTGSNSPGKMVSARFRSVSYTGIIAYAVLETRSTGDVPETDFILLSKFEDGWKIVSITGHKF
ncbi:MAG: nuclear transport factor 2 family protein [Bacteroidales bacterium]|nr:nuclear transport factor 2 family protein [Bacteroidales bacterium]